MTAESVVELPEVSVTAYDPTGSEAVTGPGPSTGLFEFRRTGDLTAPLTVAYGVAGAATPGLGFDYAPLAGTVTFPADEAVRYVGVSPHDDTVRGEGGEDVVVTLAAAAGVYDVPGGEMMAAVVIADDDPPLLATVSVGRVDATLQEGTGNGGGVELLRTGPLDDLAVGVELGGSATHADDYAAAGYDPGTGTVFFPAGQDRLWVGLTAVDDVAVEGDETVEFGLLDGPGYLVGDGGRAGLTLYDDDEEPGCGCDYHYGLQEVSFAREDAAAAEAGPDAGSFLLGYSYWSESGGFSPPGPGGYVLGGTAVEGEDYTASLAQVLVVTSDLAVSMACACPVGGEGEPGGCEPVYFGPVYMVFVQYRLTVTPVDDAAWEGDESIDLVVPKADDVGLSGGGQPIALADDETAKPTVSVTAADGVSAEQNTSSGLVWFERDDVGLTAPLTVTYTVGGTADYATPDPEDPSDLLPNDYELAGPSHPADSQTGTISFSAGQKRTPVRLTPVDDAELEYEEYADFTLDPSPNYYGGGSMATVLVLDNEAPPTLIQTVTWEQAAGASGGALDANPNAGSGKRIFAERQAPNTQIVTDEVAVKVQLTAPVANVRVKVRLFDVDDPSSNQAPVDDETDPERGDNRREVGTLDYNGVSNAQGIVTVTASVSHQPGNNYRAVATVEAVELTAAVKAKQNDAARAGVYFRAGGAEIPAGNGKTVKSSDQLTVWRTLHIEQEHMKAPRPAVGNDPGDGPFDGAGVFTTDLGSDDPNPGGPLRDPDLSWLQVITRDAYVETKADLAAFNKNPEWDFVHQYGEGLAGQSNFNAPGNVLAIDNPTGKRDVVGKAEFWAVAVLGAYDPRRSEDHDHPTVDGNTKYYGSTVFGRANANPATLVTAVVFLESIRTYCIYSLPLNLPNNEATVEKYVTAHEVGHRLGAPHEDGGLMSSQDAGDGSGDASTRTPENAVFRPVTLVRIRSNPVVS